MAGLVRSGSGVGLADAEQHSRAAAAAEGKEKEEGIDSVRAGGGGGGGSAAGASPAAVAVGSVSGIGARQPRPPPPPGPPSGSPSGGEEEGDDGYGLGVATPLSDLYGPSVLAPALALAATAAAATGEPSSSLSSQPPPPPPSPEPLRRRGSSGVLSGLARLLPLGMMPRTSLRYKRHLSCADMDAFQGLAAEAAAVTEALALPPACIIAAATSSAEQRCVDEAPEDPDEDDPRFGHRGAALLRMEAAWRAEQQLLMAQAQQGGGREEGKATTPPSSPSPPPSPPPSLMSHHPQGGGSLSGSPRSPSRPSKGATRFRRCASMPVGPIHTDGGRGLVVNFPGGGKYFYWQSGVATFLNRHFDLRHAKLVGASAGSLTAALMACDVDAHHATEVAVRILRKYGVYERPMGLVGVWGAVVRDWLDEILPSNAHELCTGRVHISVLCLPYRRHHVSDFTSKQDLIDTCLASAHLPVVMDGKPFFLWRGWPCVDGSILAGRKDVPPHLREHEHVTFDYVEDEALRVANKQDFMALSDPDGLKALVEMGYQFAERLTHSGLLPPVIQTLRKLDLGTLARAALHLREPSKHPPATDDDQHPHLPIGSPIQEGEDEDAASPVHRSVGGIHGSPSSSSSSSSSSLSSSSSSSSTAMVHVDVGIAIPQSPNPALLAALGRHRKDGEEGGAPLSATTAGLTSMGKGGFYSSRGPSRASSVITGATDLESPFSSPGEEGVYGM